MSYEKPICSCLQIIRSEMEKKRAPFMLAFLAILLCSSSSSILCSNIEAEDMAELELGNAAAATTSSDAPPLINSCNQVCITNADCKDIECPSCNHNPASNKKECGPIGRIKLWATHDEENIRVYQ
ncbi:uncharacterized protein LOC116002587 [Ipomoea triloba]|uniref:uncharacterized protein LOC116002587 n=1 Tax=Ipomoea triloba TaxID=35885 RepID=UPI00125D4329|nr:uncharacterized protein LOC116002587 [Ipomoea triloba]